MAKGTFLKDLLGELSLDRALLQILDEPYVKDLATRLKKNDAINEVMNKLDKDEGVYGWMDYDQLMDLRVKSFQVCFQNILNQNLKLI